MTKTRFYESFWVATGLTLLSYIVGLAFGWFDASALSPLEVAAVHTSYMCTYLCVHQTRWNYPIGILTTFLYSWLFFKWEMYAVALFNLYLVGSQLYGWFRWGSDEYSLPVTRVVPVWWLGYALLGLGIWALLASINYIFGVTITNVEIIITVLSGVAQFLLDNKKLETWQFWFVVNVLSIWFYFQGGLYLVGFQYIFFLLNTVYGFWMWNKSVTKVVSNDEIEWGSAQ